MNGQRTLGWEEALHSCFRGNVTLSFETGRQNRMIISKAAIWALNTPPFSDLLIDQKNLSLLLLGTDYENPYSMRIGERVMDPLCQNRQQLLTRAIDRAGWRKGYRYTISAIILEMSRKPVLCFDLQRATFQISSRIPA